MRSAVDRGTFVLRPFRELPSVSSVHSVVNPSRLGVRPIGAACSEQLVQVGQNELRGGKMQTCFAATQVGKVLQMQTKLHAPWDNTLPFCPTKTRFRFPAPKPSTLHPQPFLNLKFKTQDRNFKNRDTLACYLTSSRNPREFLKVTVHPRVAAATRPRTLGNLWPAGDRRCGTHPPKCFHLVMMDKFVATRRSFCPGSCNGRHSLEWRR